MHIIYWEIFKFLPKLRPDIKMGFNDYVILKKSLIQSAFESYHNAVPEQGNTVNYS